MIRKKDVNVREKHRVGDSKKHVGVIRKER
jgi:hypothetical protein